MEDGLGRKIITRLAGLRFKFFSYFIDENGEDKKAKVTKIRS